MLIGQSNLIYFNSIKGGRVFFYSIVIFLLESNLLIKKEFTKVMIYDNINLIPAEKRAELLQDLKIRTGLNIHRVEIQEIDFLKDATRMTVYYYE